MPLLAELYSIAQLERHARGLAEWQRVTPKRGPRRDPLSALLDENEDFLRRAYARIRGLNPRAQQTTPAIEWFVDNYLLIDEQIRLARRHLPPGYSRELPRLLNGPAAGTPRVYHLALELISHAHGRLDVDTLRAFFAAYQSIQPLQLGELWAIPIMLRLSLLESLRRVMTGVIAGSRERDLAGVWAERLVEVAALDASRVILVLAEMIREDPPLTDAFVVELTSRLRGQGAALEFPITWLDQRLAESGRTIERAFHLTNQSLAFDQVTVGNSIGGLRFLGATDWSEFVEETSAVERVLRSEASGIYPAMDFATRDRYRHAIEAIAERSPLSQVDVARRAIALAGAASEARHQHVGYFLVDGGRTRLEREVGMRGRRWRAIRRVPRRARLPIYVGVILALTAGAILLAARAMAPLELGVLSHIVLLALVAFAGLHLAIAVAQWLATILVRPRALPRLDFRKGIPAPYRTAVVVPTLLTDLDTIEHLVEHLEIRYLANRDPELLFGLLTDFRDAESEHQPDDEALLRAVREGIETLNRRYAAAEADWPFFLCHRARRWNSCEGVWMGWERKRGKLEDFNALVRGEGERFALVSGPLERLQGIAFAIVLDSDTELPRDTAHQLVGTFAHPLQRPSFTGTPRCVRDGYTILQPRVGITLASTSHSRYARLFADEPGIDPYTRTVSDVYQDVFAEGSFIGKGIYDVDAMRTTCGGRFPENRILSHDLLEGAHGRAGLVSDVVLYEDHPAVHSVDVARRARWIRGDWQIARWLMRRVPCGSDGGGSGGTAENPISLLSKLKILDNLRRSLVPIGLLALLAAGCLFPRAAMLALVAVLATFFVPCFLVALSSFVRRPSQVPLVHHAHDVVRSFVRHLVRELFALACLPFIAAVHAAAIARTVARVHFTQRRLLEWTAAADAARSARTSLLGTYASMWMHAPLALAFALALSAHTAGVRWLGAALPALWLLAPAAAWWLSRPLKPRTPRLSEADLAFLRVVARRTWRYFEVTSNAADHFLAPDNLQEDPPLGIAHRTSPTNIGCGLIANLAAYDLGYATAGHLIARTQSTFTTLERLERYRGHFYNWYDTRTLDPLRPMYVSTVDSGNLTGFLITLAAGFGEILAHPLYRSESFAGLRDTLEVLAASAGSAHGASSGHGAGSKHGAESASRVAALRTQLAVAPKSAREARDALLRAGDAARDLARSIAEHGEAELVSWAQALEDQVQVEISELRSLAPWVELDGGPQEAAALEILSLLEDARTLADAVRIDVAVLPLLDSFAGTEDAAGAGAGGNGEPSRSRAWAAAIRTAVVAGAENARQRTAEIEQLVLRCGELAEHDVEFLYDPGRRLLAIGYHVGEHRLDASFYDLLASEARLASYLAIASGKLPQEHWFHLGRQLTTAGGRPALLSWSGSMFEYLMPLLVMPNYRGTLLDSTCRAAVQRQIEHGREHGVPWGVSESCYHKMDAQLNYQYRAFGVPGLGFKRGLEDDLVIAPYATALALVVAPEAACANLRRLARDGRLGACGFFEAIDYTPQRLPPGKSGVPIRTYMAHHQGMSLLALVHVLAGRPMQRRFSSDPSLRATDLLLQERVPRQKSIEPHPAEASALQQPVDLGSDLRILASPNTLSPEVCLLSNGRYHVMVTNAGGGSSRWRDLAVTRWREDPTCDPWGTFIYVRDVATGSCWSSAHQPTLRRADRYEAIFSPGRAEFRRRDEELETHVEISVSPEDDIEMRRISIANFGRSARRLDVTSYAEIVLATPAADQAHPAFSNLFVQTEILREHQAILCTRRPRSASERPPWVFHLMTVHAPIAAPTSYESAREAFLGRGRSPLDPAAMHRPALSNGAGAVLDPIVAIRNTFVIETDATVRLHLVTGISETREGALALIEKYTDRHLPERVFELAWTQSQVLHRQLELTRPEAQTFDRIAGHILYSSPTLRASRSVLERNKSGQARLWPYGISGDLPIVLLRITGAEQLGLTRELVRAHAYWRLRGLPVDLVLWNEDPSGYRQNLQDSITALVGALAERSLVDRPGGIFVRRSDQMKEEDCVLLQTVARVVLSDAAGTLAEQIARRPRSDRRLPAFKPRERLEEPYAYASMRPPRRALDRADLVAVNGLGGFRESGREYVITTTQDVRTPAPWSNVIASPHIGTVISESGSAYTWCENAHGYRLTPWMNDPISDAGGEALYVRDEDDGRVWSPTPLPAGGANPYTTRHGFGYSVFEYAEAGIATQFTTYVAIDAPVKFLVVKISNTSRRHRRVTLTGYFELVLGTQRPQTSPHVVTEIDLKTGALFARNPYSEEFAHRVTFLECSDAARSFTGDRQEFLGRNGHRSRPKCLSNARLSGRVGAGLDPCVAMQVGVDLVEGQEREIAFLFGSGRDLDDARRSVQRFRGTGAAQAALEQVHSYWTRTLGAVEVKTPDQALDVLANGWLIYQALSCRMWARSGYYQSGGAYGFRDQLQDAAALIHAEPTILREHLLRAAEHQFLEGDVQHWWHPPLGRGVRTRISDDYLWLPSVVTRYVEQVGDTGVLDERVPFLEGRPVGPEEDSYYDLPLRSPHTETLYEHCVRALRHALRFGEHGLPLMGSGDWNDAMNLVGDRGRGESVWLGFFLYDVLTGFARIARRRGDAEFADSCVAEAATLRKNLEAHAWDGDWYKRGWFDDGSPLGSKDSPECSIDSLPQSWAVLSGAGPPERTTRALASLDAHLVDRRLAVVRLFDPPFDRSPLEPGYVKGYLPGVRENGGQYTHAAIWAGMAFAKAGDLVRAWELWGLVNPVAHGGSRAAVARYKVEPYVVAADVYTRPPHEGRGGWTWYTGSAGWMYRWVVESLLGLRLEVDRLRLTPLLPPEWPGFELVYRWRNTAHKIRVVNQGGGTAVTRVTADGVERTDFAIPLHSDGKEHEALVIVGMSAP